MTYLVVAVVLLSVVVIVLAWRMADFVQMVEGLSVSLQQEAIWRTSADDVRPTYAAYDGINARLNALAAALGYEWKRTGAKEGWERKPTAYEGMRVSPSFGCVSPFLSVSRACSEKVDADVMALFKRRKTDHGPTADRRKGERRKPAPKKKPRRGKS